MSSEQIKMLYNHLIPLEDSITAVVNGDEIYIKWNSSGESKNIKFEDGMFYYDNFKCKSLTRIKKELNFWIQSQIDIQNEQQRRSDYKKYLIENLFDILYRLTDMGIRYDLTKDENGRYISFDLYESKDINIDNPSIYEHIDDMLDCYQEQLDAKRKQEIKNTIQELKSKFCLKDIKDIKEGL